MPAVDREFMQRRHAGRYLQSERNDPHDSHNDYNVILAYVTLGYPPVAVRQCLRAAGPRARHLRMPITFRLVPTPR